MSQLWRCNGGFGPCTAQNHLRTKQFVSDAWNSSRVAACALRNEEAGRGHRPRLSSMCEKRLSGALRSQRISSTCKVGQKLGVSLPLLTCSPLAWPPRLLYRRGRKSRRDLWITLYFQLFCVCQAMGPRRIKSVCNCGIEHNKKLAVFKYHHLP